MSSIRFNGSITTTSGNRLCNNWTNHKISINFAEYKSLHDGKDIKGISEINSDTQYGVSDIGSSLLHQNLHFVLCSIVKNNLFCYKICSS